MAHGYPYPCHKKPGHTKLYEIRCKLTHELLYIGVTDYLLQRRCSGNPKYKPRQMYIKELGQFDSREEAEAVETILIKRYKPVLNIATGPRSTGTKQTEEHIAKKVASQAWYKHNDDTKRKIGESNGHKVRCVETGEVFYSMAEAARSCGGQDSKISLVVRGKRKTHKGYHWELV